MPEPQQAKLAPLITFTALSFPFAALGYVMSYLPYRLAGISANAIIGKNKTQVGTLKLVSGILFTLIAWSMEARFIAKKFGRRWGALLFVIALPLAYISLLWGEGVIELQRLIAGRWLNRTVQELADLLVAERHALAQEVLDVVEQSQ